MYGTWEGSFSCYITSKYNAYYVFYMAFPLWAGTIRSANIAGK